MTTDFQKDSLVFAQKCFDDVRAMSKDTTGVSRQGYSPVETKVLEYFKKIGVELNLEISTDKAGNVWMTVPGKNRELPALVSGSHADSVPQGGNYDGLAGIVAALTVARWMRETGYQPERDYTVLMMRMEESSWFGKCYVGSLGMTGQLTEKDLALKHRSNGKTLAETIKECGFNPEDLTTGEPVVDLAKMAAFIELHIEQGPTLDSSEEYRVGIVTGIRGNLRHKTIRCIGQTAHSGAVDKQFRHDAVLAFAELAYACGMSGSKPDTTWFSRSASFTLPRLLQSRSFRAKLPSVPTFVLCLRRHSTASMLCLKKKPVRSEKNAALNLSLTA